MTEDLELSIARELAKKIKDVSLRLQNQPLTVEQARIISTTLNSFEVCAAKRLKRSENFSSDSQFSDHRNDLRDQAVYARDMVNLVYGTNIPIEIQQTYQKAKAIAKQLGVQESSYVGDLEQAIAELTPFNSLCESLVRIEEAGKEQGKPSLAVFYEGKEVYTDEITLPKSDSIPRFTRICYDFGDQGMALNYERTFEESKKAGRTASSLGKTVNQFAALPSTQEYMKQVELSLLEALGES